MLVEIPAYEVMRKLYKGVDSIEIVNWCAKMYHLPPTEAQRFVSEIELLVVKPDKRKKIEPNPPAAIHSDPQAPVFASRKVYQINNRLYAVEFGSERIEQLIHPKFAHLETMDMDTPFDHCFQAFQSEGKFVLKVNGLVIGQWLPEEVHFFTGKFSMELMNRMVGKTEADWMAVFHASALRRENQCIMVLGPSGSGKSTLAALLMAKGYHLLADDFVPVDAASREVFFFPAAVSIKEKAFPQLIPLYPQLAAASEFYDPARNKTVRYLLPNPTIEVPLSAYPCKALVFVQYDKEMDLKIEKLSKVEAFQQLVPDSWISPLGENASGFLDWFLEMPCYALTYSDNEKMVKAMDKILGDDL